MACVVDNAANITRTVELLNEQQFVDEDENETSEEIETEEIINIDHTIYHTRYAEHTFQLGIRDALKVPLKKNRSVPTFPSHRHCFET